MSGKFLKRFIILLLQISILWISPQIYAQSNATKFSCQELVESYDHKVCQQLYAKVLKLREFHQKTEYGQWKVRRQTSANSENNVYLSLEAENRIPDGERLVTPKMRVECVDQLTYVRLDIGVSLSSPVVLFQTLDRIDTMEETWNLLPNQHTVKVKGRNRFNVIRRFIKYNHVLIRLNTAQSQPLIISFQLSGLKNAITEIREACHW